MFRLLGVTIARTWPFWLVAWIALLAYLDKTAPPWDQVAVDQEFGFLPADTPSTQGEELFKRAFPQQFYPSAVVLVLSRRNGEIGDADRAFVRDVIQPSIVKLAEQDGGLADAARAAADGRADDARSFIASIQTLNDPGSGILLVSDDRQATMVMINLTTEMFENRNGPLIDKIERLITRWKADRQVPAGLEINITGSATVGRDMTRGQRDSAQATEFWTIAGVILLLVVIYRAPLLALIPLASVFMATRVALLVLSFLAEAKYITLFEGVEVYITILLYGSGVDYCLFLIARYQEEREHGAEWGDALAQAIRHVGPALAASAGTVMFGIGMMTFAQFGKFHHAGIAVFISLFIGLCVVLTFATSLLRLFGRWAFWPKAIASIKPGEEPAPQDQAAPGWLTRVNAFFSWDTLGRALTRWPGTIWLITVLLMAPLAVWGIVQSDNIDYDLLRRLPPSAPSIAGTKVLTEHFPAGATGIVTVLIYQPDADFSTTDAKDEIHLETLSDRLIKAHSRLQLADIRTVARPLGLGAAANRLAFDIPLKEYGQAKQKVLKYYVSSTGAYAGKVTRMELTMQINPLSRQGIAWLTHFEESLKAEMPGDLQQAHVYYTGPTSSMRDIRRVTGEDQIRIQLLVTGCVMVILMLLLRRVVVSLYLIASVLFSYFATLGAAMLYFAWQDPENFVGLDWKVPIFLFAILVAIGEDYNIFLMTRTHEEQEKHGPIEGIHIALVKTGRIITSCGLIMAGTFASLLAGSMEDLKHLGFALAFGVLVDTFIVRPILVPAFLILQERGRMLWSKVIAMTSRAD